MSQHFGHLSLKWKSTEPTEEPADRLTLETRLNGMTLLELVREWELERVPAQEKDIAGTYAGLPAWSAPTLYKWLNEAVPGHQSAGEEATVCLLGCSCGVLDCWPLEADITMTETQVTWSNFRQPFRQGSWSYDGFGPFVFQRAQYEAEVRQALADAPEPSDDGLSASLSPALD